MFQRVLPLLVVCLLPGFAGAQEETKPLKDGADVPSAFHPYNVTGPRKGNFHCPVTEYDLDPVVLVFVRDLDLVDPAKALLTGLEKAAADNAASRLRGVLVLIHPELPEVVGATNETDDKREELAAKAEVLAKDLGLNNVIVVLAGKQAEEKYGIGRGTPLSVVLYRKLRIGHSQSVPREELTTAKVAEILGEVNKMLMAK